MGFELKLFIMNHVSEVPSLVYWLAFNQCNWADDTKL